MTGATMKAGIVWLASYPRSGNTWTRHFLNNLMDVMAGGGAAPRDINAPTDFTLWDIAAARFETVLGKPADKASRAEIAAARLQVQRLIADEMPEAVLVKTHNALLTDRGHPTINMGATSGALYIVRNPLDVCISFAHHFGIGIDTAIARMARRGLETDVNAEVVHEVYGSWSENVHSWTRRPHKAILVVRYEDMHAAPVATFGGLARHLLLDPTHEQLVRAIALSSFGEAKRQEGEKGYRERPKQSKAFFREGRAEQWREVLSAAQVRRIVEVHREQMARFGYVPDGI